MCPKAGSRAGKVTLSMSFTKVSKKKDVPPVPFILITIISIKTYSNLPYYTELQCLVPRSLRLPGSTGQLLCEVCMFSVCLRGFPPPTDQRHAG